MKKCLLSIDCNYFIYTKNDNLGFCSENKKSLIDLWYKRYIQAKARGRDIQKEFKLSLEIGTFWNKIRKCFKFVKDIKVYVSDSHALSYKIAKENDCKAVYLFDAHADLGYGGFSSLNFEVNCSNWLGKLMKEEKIKEANIFYSPYTAEKPEHFKTMNSIYNIRYYDFNDLGKSINDLNKGINRLNRSADDLDKCISDSDKDNIRSLDKSINGLDRYYIAVSAIHICRSGAWTPPWFDNKFFQFINSLGIPYKMVNCPERKWDTNNISLSDQINYLMA